MKRSTSVHGKEGTIAQLSTLKVYYDAACPGCRRDRLRYERWAGQTAAGVKWLDVNAHETHLREKSIDPRAALLSLHVEDEQGHIRDGLDAYILLMRRVPRLKPMAGVIGLPGIKTLLSWCYGHWVKRRLAREGRLPTD